jgi:hypothetical protein
LKEKESEIHSKITARDMILKMEKKDEIFHENKMIIFCENEGLSL